MRKLSLSEQTGVRRQDQIGTALILGKPFQELSRLQCQMELLEIGTLRHGLVGGLYFGIGWFFAGRGVDGEERPDHVAADVEAEDLLRLGLGVGRVVGELDPARLPAPAGEDL